MARPAQAIIDLAALRHNYQLAQRLSVDAVNGGQVMPIVKANAYGHGAIAIAKALEPLAPALGVACIEEALELRQAGITCPILLLEGIFSAEEVLIACEHNFWLMLENQFQLDAILSADLLSPLQVWLKIDTGMHRLGILPEQTHSYYQQLQASPNVADSIVVATHLASSDDLSSDFTAGQLAVFRQATTSIKAPISLANSPGLLGWPETRGDWNRPGFMLYGNSPFSVPQHNADQLQPVMTLKSAIISLRELAIGESVGYSNSWQTRRRSLIATVAMGYGDGYPRQAPSGTPVLVNGQRVPLVGRVSMDMITVDVTDIAPVQLGDEVILWGAELTANEIAGFVGTIGYEVLTRMPLRTPRVYINE
ncbi:MAG: alanine racemase [Oceanicoccus sp.]|jgi:alanine racemase